MFASLTCIQRMHSMLPLDLNICHSWENVLNKLCHKMSHLLTEYSAWRTDFDSPLMCIKMDFKTIKLMWEEYIREFWRCLETCICWIFILYYRCHECTNEKYDIWSYVEKYGKYCKHKKVISSYAKSFILRYQTFKRWRVRIDSFSVFA